MIARMGIALDGHKVPIVEINGSEIHLGSMGNAKYASTVWRGRNIPKDREVTSLMLFGIGDGQIAVDALEYAKESLLIYEPCKEIYNMVKTTAVLKKLNKSPQVIITTDLSEFNKHVSRVINDDNIEGMLLKVHPGYDQAIWRDEIVQAYDNLKLCMECRVEMVIGLREAAEPIIRAELSNIPYMKDGVMLARLRGRWDTRVPVIVVGAGPSLRKNVDELRRVGNNACIICMDSAYQVLLEHGVVPHMLATVDAEKQLELFGDVEKLRIPLVLSSNAVPELVSRSPALKIWCRDHRYVSELLEEAGVETPIFPVEVGVSSLVLATVLELGVEKVIFVGTDLAYSADKMSHSVDMLSELGKDEYEEREELKKEGYYGDIVMSRPDWYRMQQWYEKIIEEDERRIYINATEGGVRIRGTVQKPLKEVVDGFAERSGDWLRVIYDPEVYLTDKEYEKLMNLYENGFRDFDGFRNLSLEETIVNKSYHRPRIFQLVVGGMHGMEGTSRKERYRRSMEMLGRIIDEIRMERKDENG